VIDSLELVVRKFLTAWADPNADELSNFFNDDAVWVDGPQGVRRGANAIVDELVQQLAISHHMTMEGGHARREPWDCHGGMARRLDHGWQAISTTVMAVFEIDATGGSTSGVRATT
jgi:SnoaL-like domain